jgi:hypothetical protein
LKGAALRRFVAWTEKGDAGSVSVDEALAAYRSYLPSGEEAAYGQRWKRLVNRANVV